MTDASTPSSMAELARLADVSVSTVSRALAGNPSIKAATRTRIVDLARVHGFRPNAQARNLRLGKTHAIGVALPLGHQRDQHLTDPFFLPMLGYLADEIAERGFDMLLTKVIPTDDDWLDRLVDSGRTDGLIVVGQSDQHPALERAAARTRQLVIWGADRPDQGYLTVGTDNAAGGRLAADHLMARGCRRLLFLGDVSAPEIDARWQGARAAGAERGVEVDRLAVPLVFERALAALRDEFRNGVRIDGVVGGSDVIAAAALHALAEVGAAVPGQVRVTGFDDVTLASQTLPPLTTVRQDLDVGAKALVDGLFERMAGRSGTSIAMAPVLIARESTGG